MRNFALQKNKQGKAAPQTEPPPSPQSKALAPWPPTGPLQNDGTVAQRMSDPPLPSGRRKNASAHSKDRARGQGRRAFATFNNKQFFYKKQAETLYRLSESPFSASGLAGFFDPSLPLLNAGGCAPCKVPGRREQSLRTPILLK